ADLFGISEREASLVIIGAKNYKNLAAVKAAKKKIAFLPHCIRSPVRLVKGECRASFDENGFHCKKCDDTCQVKLLQERLKIPVFVTPGSTILFRIIKREKPGAVIGFGCIREIEDGLAACEKLGIPALGVALLNDGCFKTLVDFESASELLSQVGAWKNAQAQPGQR
ncbi:MAG: DUF116 domain-containing protein, partial [Candidatus Norongarragalinales archaeon]